MKLLNSSCFVVDSSPPRNRLRLLNYPSGQTWPALGYPGVDTPPGAPISSGTPARVPVVRLGGWFRVPWTPGRVPVVRPGGWFRDPRTPSGVPFARPGAGLAIPEPQEGGTLAKWAPQVGYRPQATLRPGWFGRLAFLIGEAYCDPR